MAVETGQQPVLPGLKAELIGDCTWTLQQNQSVITALKRENKDLKAALAALSPASSSRQALVQAELHSLNIQVNDLRKYHNKLVQTRQRDTTKLAQLKDSIKDLETDSQLVFKESPGSQLVKSLDKKLTAALTKHDAAQSTCQDLEQTAQSLRDHRLTHNRELSLLEEAVTDRQVELQDVLATHAAARQTQEQAKAELASVEQQLLAQRASRTAHLEQRSAQVRQQQEQHTALHQAALQRFQQWQRLLQSVDGGVTAASETRISSTDAGSELPSALTAPAGKTSAAEAASAEQASAAEPAAAGEAPAEEPASIALDAAPDASANAAPDAFSNAPEQAAAASHTQDSIVSSEGAAVSAISVGPSAPVTAPGSAVTSDQEAALNNSNHTGDNATDQSLSDQGAGNSQANQEGQQSAIEGPAEPSQTALALADAPGTDAASAVAAGVTLGADSNGMLTSQHDASGAAVQSVSTPLDVDAMPDQASCPSQVDMPDLAHPDGGAEVCDQAVALQHRSQDATSPADAQNCSVQFSASNLIAPSTADGGSASDLSCRQAFAALQYATGVVDMTQLVDRFLAQDSTRDTLQQLQQEIRAQWQHLHQCESDLRRRMHEVQHRRQQVHEQAEAAIVEAQAQQQLNAAQYDQAGRSLVHIKAAVQTLVEKLQPLFPEMALQSASSETLCDAVHSCESCLRQAQLAVEAAKKQLGLRPQAPGSDDGADILVSCPVENQSSVMSLAKTTSGSAGSQQPEADVRRDHFNAEQEADLDSASLLHVPGSVSLLSQPDIV